MFTCAYRKLYYLLFGTQVWYKLNRVLVFDKHPPPNFCHLVVQRKSGRVFNADVTLHSLLCFVTPGIPLSIVHHVPVFFCCIVQHVLPPQALSQATAQVALRSPSITRKQTPGARCFTTSCKRELVSRFRYVPCQCCCTLYAGNSNMFI